MQISIVNGATTFWLCHGATRGLEKLVGPSEPLNLRYSPILQNLAGLRQSGTTPVNRLNFSWTFDVRVEMQRASEALAHSFAWDFPGIVPTSGTLTFTEGTSVRTTTKWTLVTTVRASGVRVFITYSITIGGPLTAVTG